MKMYSKNYIKKDKTNRMCLFGILDSANICLILVITIIKLERTIYPSKINSLAKYFKTNWIKQYLLIMIVNVKDS